MTRVVETADEGGVGVELGFSDERARQRYQQVIEQLRDRFLAGDLPDALIS